MEVPVMDMTGKQVKTIDLPADIFEVEVNVGLMHQAYVRQISNARLGTHKSKTRHENSRTTAKWYRQKGTGRARHGSRSAAQFVGGYKSTGPKPHKYTKSMPRKMRQQAIRCALSALLRDEQLVFVDDFNIDTPKTKEMDKALQELTGSVKTLVLLPEANENVQRALANLSYARWLRVNYLNMRDLLQYEKVIVPLAALDVIQTLWGRKEA
jgi:large subunit ribosomal protein L4